VKMLRSLEKPGERFLGNLEVLRIAGLHIGPVEDVVPGGEAVLVAWPGLDHAAVVILGKPAQEFQVVRGRAVIGEGEEQAGIGSFDGLM